jgi:hypothetical protein
MDAFGQEHRLFAFLDQSSCVHPNMPKLNLNISSDLMFVRRSQFDVSIGSITFCGLYIYCAILGWWDGRKAFFVHSSNELQLMRVMYASDFVSLFRITVVM